MIVHTVDTLPGAQGSAYQAAYYAQQLPAAAPPARVASNAPVAVTAPSGHAPLAASRDPAPCSIRHGYADARGWGGVIAECGGSLVSVGSQLSAAAGGAGDSPSAARRVLLRSLEPDMPGVHRLLLPSALMLLLAALALYFVARSFTEEPYRG